MVDAYQLAEGHDNIAGYEIIEGVDVSNEPIYHASSLGTFATGREIVTLDSVVHDDGFDQFEWTFAAMTPAQFKYIKDTFLDGARSGLVTVRTKTNDDVWVDRNATLTLPRLPSRTLEKYSDVVLSFTFGEDPA